MILFVKNLDLDILRPYSVDRQINVFKVKFVTNDPKIVGLALENWSVKK